MDEYVQWKLDEKAKAKEEAEGGKDDKKKDKKPDKKKDKGATLVEIKGDPDELGLPTERNYVLVEWDFRKHDTTKPSSLK